MIADVGVAILGTGFIGRVHAKAARLNGARVVGVAASTPERAREACAELGADRADDAEALVEAPDIDVVHIATPNHLHESLAVAALKAGKHVICEKPLAFDTPGALRIADAAESAGRIVAVPFVYRFHPVVRQGRAMVERGDLGTIRLLHGSYQQDWMSSAERLELARRPRRGWAVAGVRRHRFALVRPGRVRHWSPHHEGVRPPDHGHRRTDRRLTRRFRGLPARPKDPTARRVERSAPRTWPWCCSRPTTACRGRSS